MEQCRLHDKPKDKYKIAKEYIKTWEWEWTCEVPSARSWPGMRRPAQSVRRYQILGTVPSFA
jgi:hypothetical protein